MSREVGKITLVLMGIEICSLSMAALVLPASDRPSLAYAVIVVVLASAGLLLTVRKFYTFPIELITRNIRNFVRGEGEVSFSSTRQDELGFLARRLEEMSLVFKRRVEQALSDKEEVRAVLSSMSEGVLVIGADRRILHASRAAGKMLDLRASEPIGRHFWEVLRHNETIALIDAALRSQELMTREVSISVRGTSIFFSVQIAPVFDPIGKLNSVVALFHDISEFKQFEKMRSEFVANVSHELKTPLTSIRGFTETLKHGGINDRSKALHFLDIIEVQTLRLEKLVSDVLTLASIESQSSQGAVLMRTPQSLSSILRELIILQQPDILARQHELDILIPEALPHVLGVRSELEVVFQNLVNNAIKFTPQKGHIKVRAYEADGMVRVDIEDNGVGIAPEHQERLFERFYRVDKARSQDMGGTGLGLSIVKHIVSAHSGRVELSSSVGWGSIFSVILPKV